MGCLAKLAWLRLRRVHVAILVFIGLITNYMLRVNINMTIEYMTNPERGGGPKVDWTLDQKESIKSALFIGYVIMQVPGGRLGDMFGTKKVFGLAMFLCAILAALIPVISTELKPDISFPLIYALRLVQGLVLGPCFPILNPLTNRWSPESEKGTFVSFSYLGGTFGSVITFPLCGIIIRNTSWVWVYYISAGLTFLWFALWMLFFHDFPENDPFITEDEKKLIIGSRAYDASQEAEDRELPLIPLVFDILKTPAVWVDMCGDFCNGIGFYVMLTEAPAFFKALLPLGEDPDTLGYICAIPLLGRALYGFTCGAVSDYMINSGRISRLNMQKVIANLAFLFPAAGMIGLSFLLTPELQVAAVAVLVFTFSFNGGTMSSYIQNLINLAPNRSGTLYGISNGFGNITGFLVPEIKKRIVLNESSISEWRWMFVLACGFYCAEAAIFTIFAKDAVQAFNFKSYAGVTTLNYFTSGQIFKLPKRQ